MDITPRKRKLDISCHLDNLQITPKKSRTMIKYGLSPGSDSSSDLTPDQLVQKPTSKENETSDCLCLTPPSCSYETSTPFNQASISNVKSFYKMSTIRIDKESRADLRKRYLLLSPFVLPNKTTIETKLKATPALPRTANKVSRKVEKQAPAKVQKKKNSPSKHFKIVIKPIYESKEKSSPTPILANRKFFKSGGLSDRSSAMFRKRLIPLASMKKVISKDGPKTTTNHKLGIETIPEDEKPPFELSYEERSSVPSSPNAKESPKEDELEKLNNKTKQQWPIKYKPDVLVQKATKKKSNSPLTPIGTFRRNLNGNEKQQMMIDAGQTDIGPKHCNECGMLYAANDENDVAIHIKMHKLVNTNLSFAGWKKERVMKEYDDGRVILVLPEDPYYAHKKVDDVKKVVDQNLGFSSNSQPNRLEMKVYLYVSAEKKIVGSLFAEPIKSAFRIVDKDSVGTPLCCGTESEPASCGVNRIWTLASHRRRGIASRLLNCMRQSFYYGCILSRDDIAFTDPTPDGHQFANNYFKSPKFLVYKC